jgi:hypothetical protein
LKQRVGRSGRPVIITHHVDVARYSTPCDPGGAYENKEWDPCDVAEYHRLIADYNVVAVLYGHTHARQTFKWDGRPGRGAAGVDVYNVDESSHFASENHALFYVECTEQRLTVREYSTRDNWRSGNWTGHWTHEIGVAPALKA